MASSSAFHVKVYGKVQGVGFRYSALRTAERFGVTGWVRNELDGTVEVFVEGSEDRVKRFLTWLKKGPTGSFVRQVLKQKSTPKNYTRFFIDY